MCDSSTRRGWFRFSLRMLFVVMTLLSLPMAWLTWNGHLAQERWKLLRQPGVLYRGGPAGPPRMYQVIADYGSSLPLGLWLVGACPLDTVELTELWGNVFTSDDVRRYQTAFPEARVRLRPATPIRMKGIPRRRPIMPRVREIP